MSVPIKLTRASNLSRVGRYNVSAFRAPNFRCMSSSSGGRGNCAFFDKPRCSPELLEKTECMAKAKDKATKPKHPFHSMWENPKCCNDPCPDVLPRFDDLYWSISDKSKRAYAQTWVECPRLKILPKKVCCFEPEKLPPMVKRPKKCCPKTACSPKPECQPYTKCRKIQSPCCGKARDPPSCKFFRGRTDCTKICAPYPSFSECNRQRPGPLHPIECKCLTRPTMCEVYAYIRRMRGDHAKSECQ